GLSRRGMLRSGLASAAALALPPAALSAPQAFQPSWDSLVAGYRTPDWFRDAKFGIWAHWSAQCVPEMGDWYARHMYMQGHWQYEHHLRTYGHPSKSGFMEIQRRWTAEAWEPEALMDLYVKAGARYFVALANHHDNHDTYNSKYHAWNTLRVGPKRDIVGTWAKAARARGLRFGVSNHSAHAWHWFQTAYGYDAEGPLAGQRYDAFRLRKADGAGTWWQGLDPQELYTGRNIVVPDGIESIAAMNAWHEANDRVWNENPPPNNPAFVRQWLLRCRDLIDSYRPDLVYFDNTGLPLGQAGLDATAHFYNASLAWHQGKLEAVVNAKMLPPEHRGGVVEDVERGRREGLDPLPWQTDTCLGDWHYNRGVYEKHEYKSARTVIHMLCDIVAKNGNLLLSVPMRGDGSIDADEREILGGIGDWMARNGEAIYGTRPWRQFGEGPTKVAGGMFNESKSDAFSGEDIRFTSKAGAVYAIALGWPEGGRLRIRALADGAPLAAGSVDSIQALGVEGHLAFKRSGQALEVQLPAGLAGAPAVAVRISGNGLV
ncbi:MAG TPA: alpha-L-fucosidase, partial [Burkholderiaceae bacterium]|nr:alpha-L-fucosidase [Burkholderiaceae bacterium]